MRTFSHSKICRDIISKIQKTTFPPSLNLPVKTERHKVKCFRKDFHKFFLFLVQHTVDSLCSHVLLYSSFNRTKTQQPLFFITLPAVNEVLRYIFCLPVARNQPLLLDWPYLRYVWTSKYKTNTQPHFRGKHTNCTTSKINIHHYIVWGSLHTRLKSILQIKMTLFNN